MGSNKSVVDEKIVNHSNFQFLSAQGMRAFGRESQWERMVNFRGRNFEEI